MEYLQNHKKAKKFYNKALKLDPNFAPAWMNQGIICHNLGEYEEALKCCRLALQTGEVLTYEHQ